MTYSHWSVIKSLFLLILQLGTPFRCHVFIMYTVSVSCSRLPFCWCSLSFRLAKMHGMYGYWQGFLAFGCSKSADWWYWYVELPKPLWSLFSWLFGQLTGGVFSFPRRQFLKGDGKGLLFVPWSKQQFRRKDTVFRRVNFRIHTRALWRSHTTRGVERASCLLGLLYLPTTIRHHCPVASPSGGKTLNFFGATLVSHLKKKKHEDLSSF